MKNSPIFNTNRFSFWAGQGAISAVFLILFPIAAPGKTTSVLDGFVTLNGNPAAKTVVFLEQNPPTPSETDYPPLTIKQQDQKFQPAFAVIPLGTVIRFENLDTEIHNIQSRSLENRFDTGAHMPGRIKKIKLKKAGAVPLRCRTHENMKGTVFITPTSFFTVTDPKGRYRIPNIPTGNYRLKAWNPRMTSQEQEKGTVEIKLSGGIQTVRLDLSAQAQEGQDLSEHTGKDWVATVKEIEKELNKTVSLWKKGKRTSATRRVMSAMSKLYGESGLRASIENHYDKGRADGYEKRFDSIRKQVQGVGSKKVTEIGLRRKVGQLIRDLMNDAEEMTKDLPRQINR